MSFSRSKRFNEIKEKTPGPGQYENDWGTVGSDSKKFSIHFSPRFPERCRKNLKGRRHCIDCTCADIHNQQKSDQFLINAPRNSCVKNVTFRSKPAKGTHFRKAFCDLMIFRQSFSGNQAINPFENEETNEVHIAYESFYLDMENSEEDTNSTSSAEDSGILSLSSSPTNLKENEKKKTKTSLELSKKKNEDLIPSLFNQQISTNKPTTIDGDDFLTKLSISEETNQPRLKWNIPVKKVRFHLDSSEGKPDGEKLKSILSNNDLSKVSCIFDRYEDTEGVPHSPIKTRETFLETETKLTSHVSDIDSSLMESFIHHCLEFLEKNLVRQRRETNTLLSLMSLLQKEAIKL